ncbi:UTRA domain-containing protein [Pseudarthrobacter psychrotolerans]|uniref:UTRA domain-containing protein n=1 Tax=Pseudarthrobacter psychrotolerans TaxID=2697569 RepID=A0A6P1NS38_9MICC|nr:GntR family transcriptional regulator [Pseudarthrobacter psychrotolerans]QHK21597.1 UTRA domain-containing protein [Pseudarthrobacter psychrotolerans]
MDTAGELKHVWVRKQIQDLVAASLRPGDALLGERQLEEQFGVSRITVRRAISDLVQDGALVRIKGKGTFVSHGLVRSTLHLASFNEDMRAAGFEPSTRVITALTAVPPAAAAEHLGLAAGQEAYQVRRLRLANGAPVSVDDSWLPPHLLPGLLSGDLTGSLYGVLAAFGHPVQHVEQTVQAAAALEETAALLDIAPGAPVLLFRRRSFTGPNDPGPPIEYSISTYRSDRYQVSMRLGLG